jgi:hypothetical protein
MVRQLSCYNFKVCQCNVDPGCWIHSSSNCSHRRTQKILTWSTIINSAGQVVSVVTWRYTQDGYLTAPVITSHRWQRYRSKSHMRSWATIWIRSINTTIKYDRCEYRSSNPWLSGNLMYSISMEYTCSL